MRGNRVWRPDPYPVHAGDDFPPFLAALDGQRDLFDPARPLTLARAPGRLDLMGGIADYSGSLVLELPLAMATFVAVQRTPEANPVVTARSLAGDLGPGARATVRVPLAALLDADGPAPYAQARALLTANEGEAWAAYVIGALVVLAREDGLALDRASGVRIVIGSNVPAGKGVSSSAALEVAAMQALAASYGHAVTGPRLGRLCQIVENYVVGAPSGVMDQITAACGVAGELLALRCQPAELEPPAPLPESLAVYGIDSGLRHAVGGADYGSVRVGAAMGYRIIADLLGFDVAPDPTTPGRVRINDPRFGGYLANIPPSLWDEALGDRVPVTMDGAAFLARYSGISDAVTQVAPDRRYAIRQPTAHPIGEHTRVRLFRALLQALETTPAPDAEPLALLGELMAQSHASYSRCGLGSAGTDRLVALARAVGPAAGLYGAKITGGGSGGVVAVLARRGAEDAVQEVARRYRQETGHTAAVIGGTSDGAARFGVVRLVPGRE